jgi:hypothetical protein
VDMIAAHEGVPPIIAAQLGYYLKHSPGGGERIRSMITDDIERARSCNHAAQLAELEGVLRRFDQLHGARGDAHALH